MIYELISAAGLPEPIRDSRKIRLLPPPFRYPTGTVMPRGTQGLSADQGNRLELGLSFFFSNDLAVSVRKKMVLLTVALPVRVGILQPVLSSGRNYLTIKIH